MVAENLARLVRAEGAREMDAEVIIPMTRDVEEEFYRKEKEKGVPKPVVDMYNFLVEHSIRHKFHRKEVTKGCVAAVEARSRIVGEKVLLEQELKTLVFRTRDEGLLAIHILGDKVLPRRENGAFNYEKLGEVTKLEVLTWARKTLLGKPLILGRLNPVTLALGEGVQQFYDLPEGVGPMYTNAGMNTWGVRMNDIHKVMEAVGAQAISIAVDKVPELKGTPVEQEKKRGL